jgi:hypothetical protein
MPKQKTLDLLVANHGAIFLLRPVTQAGRNWVGEHIPRRCGLWFGGAIAVEHCFLRDKDAFAGVLAAVQRRSLSANGAQPIGIRVGYAATRGKRLTNERK